MSNLAALLVIDVQSGMFAPDDPVHDGPRLLVNIQRLLQRARSAGAPVIFVQHDGPAGNGLEPGAPGWSIHPGVAPQSGEPVVRKTTPDAFFNTTLLRELDKFGVSRLVIAGIQSEVCIDTTCRRASSLSYEVVLVADAHSTWNRGGLSAQQIINHENSVLGDWFATLKEAAEVRFAG